MFEGSSHTASQSQGDVDLYVKDRCWVTLNGAKLMWLPREYRPRCSAVHGNMIALGNESGGGHHHWISRAGSVNAPLLIVTLSILPFGKIRL